MAAFGHSASMKMGNSRFATEWSRKRTPELSSPFVRLEDLRKLRGSEQVAAVCYRLEKRGIEVIVAE